MFIKKWSTTGYWRIITFLIQVDRMNMTEKFEHDQKIHTNEHYPLNLTENKINITRKTNINVCMWQKIILFWSYSPVHVRRLNDFCLLIYFWSYSSIFRSCSIVKVRQCNLLVKFHRSRFLVWIFFGHILTPFWSYWFGQNN